MKDKKMLSEIYCLNKEMNRNISRIANFVVRTPASSAKG